MLLLLKSSSMICLKAVNTLHPGIQGRCGYTAPLEPFMVRITLRGKIRLALEFVPPRLKIG
jgi:hypothetical protein